MPKKSYFNYLNASIAVSVACAIGSLGIAWKRLRKTTPIDNEGCFLTFLRFYSNNLHFFVGILVPSLFHFTWHLMCFHQNMKK